MQKVYWPHGVNKARRKEGKKEGIIEGKKEGRLEGKKTRRKEEKKERRLEIKKTRKQEEKLKGLGASKTNSL